MVGLTDLGELAYAVEKVHNRVLEEDLPATPALIEMIDVARIELPPLGRYATPYRAGDSRCRRLASGDLQSGKRISWWQRVDGHGAINAATARRRFAWPRGDGRRAAGAVASAIEVLELDETPYEEVEGPGDSHASSPPTLAFSAAPAQVVPIAGAVAALADAEEEITVGGVTLSAALYRILCEEAKQHLATLDAELQTLQFDPAATPSQLMVRASHTLCGIHRTGGFPLVATAAKALEICLLGLQERGAPLPGAAQPVLARAVAGLTALERARSCT